MQLAIELLMVNPNTLSTCKSHHEIWIVKSLKEFMEDKSLFSQSIEASTDFFFQQEFHHGKCSDFTTHLSIIKLTIWVFLGRYFSSSVLFLLLQIQFQNQFLLVVLAVPYHYLSLCYDSLSILVHQRLGNSASKCYVPWPGPCYQMHVFWRKHSIPVRWRGQATERILCWHRWMSPLESGFPHHPQIL